MDTRKLWPGSFALAFTLALAAPAPSMLIAMTAAPTRATRPFDP